MKNISLESVLDRFTCIMQRIFHGFLFIHRYPPFFPSSPFESLFFIYYKTTERKSNQREHEKYINGRLLAFQSSTFLLLPHAAASF